MQKKNYAHRGRTRGAQQDRYGNVHVHCVVNNSSPYQIIFFFISGILICAEETEENSEAEYAKSKLEYVTCLDKKLDVNRTFVTPKVSEGASGAAKAVNSEVSTCQKGRLRNVLIQQT